MRERLVAVAPLLWERRLGLVVAPAGCGKTTLLAHVAAHAGAAVAWYRAERSDGDVQTFLSGLESSLAAAVAGLPREWTTVEDAAGALEGVNGRSLLIIDDFHTLDETPAEELLERLVEYAPPALAFLVASRARPRFNLSRSRVSGALLELGPDDLRFRSWEVERLFLECYEQPLPPEDLAILTRRTEGWAAGLQLFHLATQSKPASERRRALDALAPGKRWRAAQEYLASNVLADLPGELRGFLIQTAVLPRLSGRLCDDLLGGSGAEGILDELERRQIFTHALDDDHYRYHEVLRSHLETVLIQEIGEAEAHRRYRDAGSLLEQAGDLPDALWAYCRGEDWDAVARLLGNEGDELTGGRADWLNLLPRAVVRDDAWLLLAKARRQRAEGRFEDAVAAYHDAERAFGSAAGSDLARRERASLTAWLEPTFAPAVDWLGIVRGATVRDPRALERKTARLPPVQRQLAGGLLTLLAGDLREARRLLRATEEHPEASAAARTGARIAGAAALSLSGRPEAAHKAELAADEAERLELPWLARVARAVLALTDHPDGRSEAASARLASEAAGDIWGVSLAALMEGLGALRHGHDGAERLEQAAQGFRALGAGTLEAWSASALALAHGRRSDPDARDLAVQAEARARATAVRGAQAFASLALAEADPSGSFEDREVARTIAEECSLALPVAEAPGPHVPADPSLAVECFGGFRLIVAGEQLDLSAVKPRARQVLRLLALHPERGVHREVIAEALWPNAQPEVGMRNLHVAVSSLRRVLDRAVNGGRPSLIERQGDAYRLALPDDALADVRTFDQALNAGRRALASGDAPAALQGFGRALELHRGELLPEEGPAEWVVPERERCRADACEAAHKLAQLLLDQDDPADAAAVCERGLYFDEYDDSLWRLSIAAYESAGNRAAAARARSKYAGVLERLGIPAESAVLKPQD